MGNCLIDVQKYLCIYVPQISQLRGYVNLYLILPWRIGISGSYQVELTNSLAVITSTIEGAYPRIVPRAAGSAAGVQVMELRKEKVDVPDLW